MQKKRDEQDAAIAQLQMEMKDLQKKLANAAAEVLEFQKWREIAFASIEKEKELKSKLHSLWVCDALLMWR